MIFVNDVNKNETNFRSSSSSWNISRSASKQMIWISNKRKLGCWFQMLSIRTMVICFTKFSSTSYPAISGFSYHSSFLRSSSSFVKRDITRRLMTTTSISNDETLDNIEWASLRKELLKKSLLELHIDAESLDSAALDSIHNPLGGYDNKFGKSAIRAYRSFAFLNHSKEENHNNEKASFDQKSIQSMAGRVARQIQFLINRHKAHNVEWIRHHDNQDTTQLTSESEYNDKKTKSFPIIIILDNVRSALNVGSIFRTADAAGCEAIYTTGITPHPGGNGFEKLQKSALGAEQTVPHLHFLTLQHAITYIKQNNQPNNIDVGNDTIRMKLLPYTIIGMETTFKSLPYTNYTYDQTRGVALILGNEVTGIDVDILSSENLLDAIIEIPMYGVKNSLNIAACAPIVIYEIIRQWTHNKQCIKNATLNTLLPRRLPKAEGLSTKSKMKE